METIAISFVMMAIAIAIIVWAMNVFAKAERLREEAKAETEKDGETLKTLLEKYKYLRDSAVIPNLFPLRFVIKDYRSDFYVYAEYKSINGKQIVHLPIKSFPKGDDEDFALREAEELIEHLNEK